MRISGFVRSMLTVILSMMVLAPFCQGQDAHHFTYTNNAKRIYRDIIDLKLDAAQKKLDAAMLDEPENLAYLHLASYKDFFHLFISEDEAVFKSSQKRQSKYRDRIEEHLPESNPYKRFALAESLLHSAIIRSKFGQVLRSAREVLQAYDLLSENTMEHPDFIYNKKSLSVIHSLAETVSMPDLVKRIFGIKGSIALGMEEIEAVIEYSYENDDFLFKEEVDAIYLYIMMYQANQKEAALQYLSKARLDATNSLLSTFMKAKIFERSGMNDAAIAVLDNKPDGQEYAEFFYLELMEGTCRLRKLDTTGVTRIQEFLGSFGGRHFVKEAYQKLAWSALVFEDDLPTYKFYMSKVKAEGHDLVDDDKQALKESERDRTPDPILLEARLLSDGGYHQKAYAMLVQKAYLYEGEDTQALEFNYRMGRITHALQNYPEALEYYNQTINKGHDSSTYFACNSALQSGLIFEALGKAEEAKEFYDLCLSMSPEDYKSSLHQKARTGNLRLATKKQDVKN